MLLYLRRVNDGRVIRLRARRSGWAVTAEVTEAAEVLRQARAGIPD
jgi:hypothetical protein